jgi:UDP-glucose 4-epimerase
MNILISGGAGFIGSHLAGALLRDKCVRSLAIYDNFSSGSRLHLEAIANDSRLTVVEGDIKNLPLLSDSLKAVDVVFHLAANPDIAKAVTQPDIDFWEGTYLTQNVLEAMRLNNVQKLLDTSGSGVYGEVPGIAFAENYGPCVPISTYGASKLACEGLIAAYCHMFGMTGRVFRFANVVGPRQTHGVGYDFIRRLRADPTKLRILGDGTQCKAYIHVDDVLAAMLMVLNKNDVLPAFDILNVATDDYISVTQIADMACAACGLDPNRVPYDYSGGDRGWKGDVPKIFFDVSKVKAQGWKAMRSSRQAMEASLEAMLHEIV